MKNLKIIKNKKLRDKRKIIPERKLQEIMRISKKSNLKLAQRNRMSLKKNLNQLLILALIMKLIFRAIQTHQKQMLTKVLIDNRSLYQEILVHSKLSQLGRLTIEKNSYLCQYLKTDNSNSQ